MKNKFKKLVGQLQAIMPLCGFDMPKALCNERELYFRRHYAWMDKKITAFVNRQPI